MEEISQVSKKFNCQICGRGYLSLVALKNHLTRGHMEGRKKCPKCPNDFCDKYYLKDHLRRAHKVNNMASKRLSKVVSRKVRKVDVGSKRSFKRVSRKVSMASKQSSNLTCPFCDGQFRNKPGIIYHLKRSHFGFTLEEVKEQYKHHCYFCKSKWPSNADLEIHLRMHTLERPFKCNIYGCGKTYRYKSHLNIHQKRHK